MPMIRMHRVRMALAMALVVATAACGANEAAPADAATEVVEALPLVRGYYVSTEVACGVASNATLALVRSDGISACGFDRIERIGESRYRVLESCTDHQGPEPVTSAFTNQYEIIGRDRYRVSDDHGWQAEFRFCPQETLPDPWRDNDISDVTG